MTDNLEDILGPMPDFASERSLYRGVLENGVHVLFVFIVTKDGSMVDMYKRADDKPLSEEDARLCELACHAIARELGFDEGVRMTEKTVTGTPECLYGEISKGMRAIELKRSRN